MGAFAAAFANPLHTSESGYCAFRGRKSNTTDSTADRADVVASDVGEGGVGAAGAGRLNINVESSGSMDCRRNRSTKWNCVWGVRLFHCSFAAFLSN